MRQRLPVAAGRDALYTLLRLSSARKGLVAGFLSCYLIGLAATSLIPILFGTIIDGIGAGWSSERLNWTAAGIVASIVVAAVFLRYGSLLGRRFGELAAAQLRERFTERVLRLDLGTVEAAGRGDLSTRTSADIQSATTLFHTNGPELLSGALEVAVIAAAAVFVHPVLGLGIITVLPPLIFVFRRYWKRSQGVFVAERGAMSEIAESLGATSEGSQTVESFRMQEERERATETEAGEHQRLLRRILGLFSWFLPATDMSLATPIVLVSLMGGLWYLGGGAITIGAISAVAILAMRLDGPLYRMMNSMIEFQQGAAALARIEGVGTIPETRRESVPEGDEIVFRNVTFGYGDGPDVLTDLDLRPQKGKRLAIVGPSGAGKSTLARLLAGIDAPRKGSVTIGGAEASDIDTEVLRRHLILVTQEHYVFNASVRDNLRLATPEADDARLKGALDAVGATWIDSLDEGLDTVLGDGGLELDPAEAQQLALARVIIADPPIVILDEATAGIDPDNAGGIEAALAGALDGRTVLAIAHQLEAARTADQVAVVSGGGIAELGSHEELVALGGEYARLWAAWRQEVLRSGGPVPPESRRARPAHGKAVPAAPACPPGPRFVLSPPDVRVIFRAVRSSPRRGICAFLDDTP
ncbi:ABC transporter ATP-binding protein [Salininema proteolyticum]|uniref:ABC transporter ATP-binding protein n=1 Tax=Salininema proteolyticum TaxID=1607685 RepID=A0ABV8TZZ9_9ACTN